jgi:hypothetical protein
MHQAGMPVKRIARKMERQNVSLRKLISSSGGIRPRARAVNPRRFSQVVDPVPASTRSGCPVTRRFGDPYPGCTSRTLLKDPLRTFSGGS